MKLEFPRLTKSKLSSVNVRSEKHGPELVPAVDLKIVVEASNDILNKFHPDLKDALYFRAQDDDGGQDDLIGVEPVTNLPNLRFPKLDTPLKWDYVGAGFRLDIDYGLGDASNLIMFGCEINNIGFSPKEGGTVEVSFRVQISDIEESIIGKLATLCQHEISIILTPPTVEDVADIIKTMESPFTNQAELDADTSDAPKNPFIEPLTPEAAFAAAVDADAAVH
jgi:hypothetical protein